MENGAEVDAVDDDGNTPVSIATFKNSIAILDLLINKKDAKINPENEKAKLPLVVALSHANITQIKTATVEWLLDHGANANILINGKNPVLRGLKNIKNKEQLFEITRLLIDKGKINVNDLLLTLAEDEAIGTVDLLFDLEQVKQNFDPSNQSQSGAAFCKFLISYTNDSLEEKQISILKKMVTNTQKNLGHEQWQMVLLKIVDIHNLETFESIVSQDKSKLNNWQDHNVHQLFGYLGIFGSKKIAEKTP